MNTQPPTSWDQIVELNFERVTRIAIRVLGCVHDAEDVAQEVFTEAYSIPEKHLVRSWGALLSKIATRRAIDHLRRTKATSELRDHEYTSNVNPYDVAAERELVDRIRHALTQLPEQQSTVFAMICFENHSRQEVAEILGITDEAVSSALYKARKRLKVQFAILPKGEN